MTAAPPMHADLLAKLSALREGFASLGREPSYRPAKVLKDRRTGRSDGVVKPTPHQLELLRTLWRMQTMHGETPTIQELADEMGISKTAMFETLGYLEVKGAIERDYGEGKSEARSLRLTPAGLAVTSRPMHFPYFGEVE